jgi:hypothetical protein
MRAIPHRATSEEQAQPIDLNDILDTSHENKWVALSPDYRRVLGVSDKLADLMRRIAQRDAIFHRVLPHDSFAPIA